MAAISSVGAYVPGSDRETDQALAVQPAMQAFLRQGLQESEGLSRSLERLVGVLSTPQAG